MCVLDRRRHKRFGFVCGVAEHDALIACAFIFVRGRINALGDMRRLFVKKVGDLDRIPVEFVLFVTNVFDRATDEVRHGVHVFSKFGLIRQANFATDYDTICGRKGFAGNAGLGLFSQKCIKNGVRDTVANLIRMAFGNRFRSENIVVT